LGRDVGEKIGRSRSVWRPLHRWPTLRIPRRHPWVNRAKSLGSSTISVCCVFLLRPWLWPAPIAHGATARCAVFAETVTTGSSRLLTRQHLRHPGLELVPHAWWPCCFWTANPAPARREHRLPCQ